MQLLIATQNAGKLREYREMLGSSHFELVTPGDIGLADFDVEETADTFTGNAKLKATAYAARSGLPALADDSGLAVDALDGAPGVYSARYAATPEARIAKLLNALAAIPDADRSAQFVCVVALAQPEHDDIHTATGVVAGTILHEPCDGDNGFGYDPIFQPVDQSVCFAALPPAEKNRLSHRGRALRNLMPLLEQVYRERTG